MHIFLVMQGPKVDIIRMLNIWGFTSPFLVLQGFVCFFLILSLPLSLPSMKFTSMDFLILLQLII